MASLHALSLAIPEVLLFSIGHILAIMGSIAVEPQAACFDLGSPDLCLWGLGAQPTPSTNPEKHRTCDKHLFQKCHTIQQVQWNS